MDTVPRVNILGGSDHYGDVLDGNHGDSSGNHGDREPGEGEEPPENPPATLAHKQPLVVRETAIAGMFPW